MTSNLFSKMTPFIARPSAVWLIAPMSHAPIGKL